MKSCIIIDSLSDLQTFFNNEIPELTKYLDLKLNHYKNYDKNVALFNDMWDYRKEYIKNLNKKIGCYGTYQIKCLLEDNFIDKYGKFLFETLYIFKNKDLETDDIHYNIEKTFEISKVTKDIQKLVV